MVPHTRTNLFGAITQARRNVSRLTLANAIMATKPAKVTMKIPVVMRPRHLLECHRKERLLALACLKRVHLMDPRSPLT